MSCNAKLHCNVIEKSLQTSKVADYLGQSYNIVSTFTTTTRACLLAAAALSKHGMPGKATRASETAVSSFNEGETAKSEHASQPASQAT